LTRPQFSALLVTCEHASNHVPPEYAAKFRGRREVLKTHRAWDPGAAALARDLEKAFNAPAFYGSLTRLLIDLNRSESSKSLFSEFTADAREELLDRCHRPWRAGVLDVAKKLAARKKLLHVSCHSFTPVWHRRQRRVDIGLLFDPRRDLERAVALDWQTELRSSLPDLRIRRNNPYRGTSDSVTKWLRGRLPHGRYAGIEVELSQAFASRPAGQWTHVRRALVRMVEHTLTRELRAAVGRSQRRG
jgi:predicted N-formylglutamate amidohydrolase